MKSLLDFIEVGIKYHSDGDKIGRAVPFLLKINNYIKSHIDAEPSLESFGEQATQISKKITSYLSANNPAAPIGSGATDSDTRTTSSCTAEQTTRRD